MTNLCSDERERNLNLCSDENLKKKIISNQNV